MLNGPLRVVAAAELDAGQGSRSASAEVDWRWYYHLPRLSGWILLVALLVLLRENRRAEAWLILVPFVLVGDVIWPGLVRLFALPQVRTEGFALPLASFLVAWTAIWVLSPWLRRVRPVLALVVVLAGSLLIGAAAESWWRRQPAWGGMQAASIIVTVAAFVLTAWRCRRDYRPGRFLARLPIWLLVAALISNAGLMLWLWLFLIFVRPTAPPFWQLLPYSVLGSIAETIAIYLVILPYMALAARSPLYADRFQGLLRLEKRKTHEPTPLPPPILSPALSEDR